MDHLGRDVDNHLDETKSISVPQISILIWDMFGSAYFTLLWSLSKEALSHTQVSQDVDLEELPHSLRLSANTDGITLGRVQNKNVNVNAITLQPLPKSLDFADVANVAFPRNKLRGVARGLPSFELLDSGSEPIL